jgi:hypothetical protein
VFGKNENNLNKSFNSADFEYFKQFPNVSIIYVPNLHGKFYGNEKRSVVTSINLYDYSFKKNIEFGVYSESGLIDQFTSSTDMEAWNECLEIAEKNEVVFIRRPVYEKKLLSALLGKNYVRSYTMYDQTEEFYSIGKRKKSTNFKKLSDFQKELSSDFENVEMPRREFVTQRYNNSSDNFGFCIRTGSRIPFNPQKPYSESAFKSWSTYKNPDYKEKFCHKTGKPSNGKTSMRNPIL